MKSRKSSPGLPPHVDPLDPRTIKWRVDQIEERVDLLEEQPTIRDIMGGIPNMVERLPWERVITPLLIIVALKLGWIGADIANSLLGR